MRVTCMPIIKSAGVTDTERLLADLCERSFLRLWSWPNPFKDDGHEFCDLFAVFENHAFIFFDRGKELVDLSEGDPAVLWNRWKRNVIEAQIKTAHGAERYLRSGRPIFLDSKREVPFPLNLNLSSLVVHKIIVGHGAAEACKKFSANNANGGLAVIYGESQRKSDSPFVIILDRFDPVHVLDSHTLPIVMGQLDTFSDFSGYMDAKVDALKILTTLSYSSEEDLLAHYFFNLNPQTKTHFIGSGDHTADNIFIAEGHWADFVARPEYIETKRRNQQSYLWDHLIQKTAANSLNGTLGGNADPLQGRSAIHEMAREPRFMRRDLAAKMHEAIERFPYNPTNMTRMVNLMPSYHQETKYVFLQVWDPRAIHSDQYFEKRRFLLEIACGAAKNTYKNLRNIVGIGVEAPKLTKVIAEDFILMDCTNWPADRAEYYRQLNKNWEFFETSSLITTEHTSTEFVQPPKHP